MSSSKSDKNSKKKISEENEETLRKILKENQDQSQGIPGSKTSNEIGTSRTGSKLSQFSAQAQAGNDSKKSVSTAKTETNIPETINPFKSRRKSLYFDLRKENHKDDSKNVAFSGVKDGNTDESRISKVANDHQSLIGQLIPALRRSSNISVASSRSDVGSRKSILGLFRRKSEFGDFALTPSQLKLVDDKLRYDKVGSIISPRHNDKTGPKNKLLDMVSRIAAKKTDNKKGNPPNIFADMLKKVNPASLERAEKKMRWIVVRKLKKLGASLIRAPLQVLTPNSYFTIFWSFFMLLITFIDILFTPFEISFYQFNRRDDNINPVTIFLEIIFLIDILVNFRTAYYEKGVITLNSKAVFKHYLKGEFLRDFSAIIFDAIATIFVANWLWFLKSFKIMRMRKIQILFPRVEEYFNLDKAATAVVKLVRLIFTILITAHWLACTLHLAANNEDYNENNWLKDQGLDYQGKVERYIAALYWSVMTMMTVGYGDIKAVNSTERILIIGAMVMACALFGYSLNTLGTSINEMNEEKAQAREKIRNLKNYMTQKRLGKNIQVRVKNYIEYMIESKRIHKHEEDQFMHLLSQNLKDEITSEVNGKILVECKIFSSNFSLKSSMSLSKYMYEKFISPEELVFEEGDENDKSIYFISYGKVQIFNKNKVVKELSTHEYFGEIAFFSGQPRQASAKSLMFSSLFYLSSETATEFLKKYPSDFENFHMIRNDINLYNKFDLIDIKCYSCNEIGHISKKCPKLHCVLPKDEIIKSYLEEENELRASFLRANRKRFHVLKNLYELQKCAIEVMEDYFDEDPSDDDISQDSIDLIIERNLYIIPAAEIHDMKLRKTEKRRKSNHNVNINFYDEFNQVNRELDGDLSDIEDEDNKAERIQDILFFTIDKVENFETFYPHNNIIRMIGDFEKKRLEKLQQSEGGVMKALFLKTLMGGRKNLLIQVQRGRRATKLLNQVPALQGRLKSSMKKAQSSIKELKDDPNHENKTGTLDDVQDKKPSGYNLTIAGPESPTLINDGSLSEEDAATISKTEARNMDRKPVNIKQYMNHINSVYSIKMPSNNVSNLTIPDPTLSKLNSSMKIPLNSVTDFSKDLSSMNKIDPNIHRNFNFSINKISSIASGTNRVFSQDLTNPFFLQNIARNDKTDNNEGPPLIEQLIIQNLFEEEAKKEVLQNQKRRVLRSMSIDKMLNFQKNMDKYNVVNSIRNVLESRMQSNFTGMMSKN